MLSVSILLSVPWRQFARLTIISIDAGAPGIAIIRKALAKEASLHATVLRETASSESGGQQAAGGKHQRGTTVLQASRK